MAGPPLAVVDPGPVVGVDGATTNAITVLLADVKIVLVFKVLVLEPMEPVPGSILVSKVEVVLVPMAPMVPCPFVVTMVLLLLPSLLVLFFKSLSLLFPLLPKGCGTRGIPFKGRLEDCGIGLGGIHREILQS